MTIGTCGLARRISSATTAPSDRPTQYSTTTASTGCDIKSRKPSLPLVAVTNPYPFSRKRAHSSGSRCMHRTVLFLAILQVGITEICFFFCSQLLN